MTIVPTSVLRCNTNQPPTARMPMTPKVYSRFIKKSRSELAEKDLRVQAVDIPDPVPESLFHALPCGIRLFVDDIGAKRPQRFDPPPGAEVDRFLQKW
ncbi:MAG: hypothetical protein ABI349_15965, partial [Casimicrobiaceae bacterium]